MQQVDDPPSLAVGTEVSAKYKGAFCEAKVSKVVRNIKVKVAYKHGLGSGIVSDELIKTPTNQFRVGSNVEVRHPERKEVVEATVTKIQDCSQYTVVFDDGDITTLRRTALCLKSGRHFNESETLDQLPLTHPEHFGNPVVGRRGRRRGQPNEDSSDEEVESDAKEIVNEKEEHIGKVVCVEMETKKKDKEKFFPGLVVAPTAQATVRIRVKDDYLVRSFKDGRYYTVPKKEATEFTRETATKQDSSAVQAALEYLDKNVLPTHWDRDVLFGLRNSSTDDEAEVDSDSSDDEPREEKDRFVAQLYKYMDDRGTPLNKVPTIQNRDVDLYRLFRAVQKRGGYNRVTAQNQWKSVAARLGFTPLTTGVANAVKQSYKKFLQSYGDFNRKLGCSMLMTPRNSNRGKGRSLVRALSVASPKSVVELSKDGKTKDINQLPKSTIIKSPSTMVRVQSGNEESECNSESSQDLNKKNVPTVGSVPVVVNMSKTKVKTLVEKFEEKKIAPIVTTTAATTTTISAVEENDLSLSKIKALEAENTVAMLLPKENKDNIKEKEVEIPTIEEKDKDKNETETEAIVEETPAIISPNDTTRNYSTSETRDPSPTGSIMSVITTSGKKDNAQRKMSLGNEEKRKRRPKQKVSLEKVDVGDFVVEVGDRLKVYYHEKKVTYEAKVIEIAIQNGIPMYMVHYTGWNIRYDEWVPRERIAEKLNKGSKHKKSNNGGNNQTQEKTKVNPPKPPSAAVLAQALAAVGRNSDAPFGSGRGGITSVSRRGRGRSEQRPTRSATPSSSSSRTKSMNIKHRRRPVRSGGRRVSMTVSDVSLPTESDTDSDEPVKPRTTRANKDIADTSNKTLKQGNKMRVENSASETGEDAYDDGDDDNCVGEKGRDYDLNQIRSELKGFQDLKAESANETNATTTSAATTTTNTTSTTPKIPDNDKILENVNVSQNTKETEREDIVKKSNTASDLSSETDCFPDDDSQSSDRTTQLQNMTKKFQQKIHARSSQNTTKSQIVEKILMEILAEKCNEGNKVKTIMNTEKEMQNKKIEEKKEIAVLSTTLEETSEKLTKEEIKAPTVKNMDMTSLAVTSNKEYLKTSSPAAAASPTSSVSSISSISSHMSFGSTRSIPDMSKLNISSASSTTSSSMNLFKDSKINVAVTTTSSVPKSISPDIYEFKDTEPFEFELRKSPLVSSANNNSNVTSSLLYSASSLSARRFKPTVQSVDSGVSQITTPLIARKKRTSPLKEVSKLMKAEVEVKTSPTSSVDKPINVPTSSSLSVTSSTILSTPTTSTTTTTATAFDDLRKSPSFNLINALNEELAQTVQETIRALTDVGVPASPSTPPVKEPNESSSIVATVTVPKIEIKETIEKDIKETKANIDSVLSDSAFIETTKIKEDVSNVFEICQTDLANTSKFGLEKAKILLSATVDGGFDLMSTPLPENKPDSIADKLLKAINQKKEEETKMKIKNNMNVDEEKLNVDNSTLNLKQEKEEELVLLSTKQEFLPKFVDVLPQVILNASNNSPDATKLSLLDGNAAKNTELNETIQKLECAIQRKPCRNLSTAVVGANLTNFSEDSIGSTDSERKLIIEDATEETTSIDLQQQQKPTFSQDIKIEKNEVKTNTVPILLPEIPATVVVATGCPKNISLNATNKEYMQILTTETTTRSEVQSEDVEMFAKNIGNSIDNKCENNVALTANQIVSNTDTHTDAINLLCEETIPGSPAPVVVKEDPTLTQQPQQQQQQQRLPEVVPKSPESNVKPANSVSNVFVKREQQVPQQQQQQLQQLHQSSPNDSASQDENHENSLSRKRRRTRKTSELEGGQNQDNSNKRRRILSNKKQTQGGSDSDEALDTVTPRMTMSTRNQQIQQQLQQNYQETQEQISTGVIRPCPYNFLVQLDPQLSSDQCITILMKQIQELKKTYNDIKSDLAAIDRRRKKLRRRDREKKQNQNQHQLPIIKVGGVS